MVIIREYVRNHTKYQCCDAVPPDALNVQIANILCDDGAVLISDVIPDDDPFRVEACTSN